MAPTNVWAQWLSAFRRAARRFRPMRSSEPPTARERALALKDRRAASSAGDDWAVVASVGSAAMGSLYQQVLRSAGIPVLPREWGGGSALVGGVPVGVSLFVPRTRLAEARAVLNTDVGEEGDDLEG